MDVHAVPTMTHGRVLVRDARAAARKGLLVGFHGYMESAKTQMDRLQAIPGGTDWTLVSIQGLHRFYRGRSEEVVASWMTREDRELAMADNLAYVAAALDQVPHDRSTRVVYTGFSQGVATVGRWVAYGRVRADQMILWAGAFPPDVDLTSLADRLAATPVVLVVGSRDELASWAGADAQLQRFAAAGIAARLISFDGGHRLDNATLAALAGSSGA